MATNPFRLSEKAQNSLVGYVKYALEENKRRNDVYNKMCFIDAAYARYKQEEDSQGGKPGDDVNTDAAGVPCGSLKDITAPIVISQVDSFTGYLADIFCSGYPMFPVVSNPKQRKEAQTLQAITDTHAMLGGYQRQFVKFFRDCMKYNFGAVEIDWAPIERYSLLSDVMKPLDPSQVKKQTEFYNRITRRDAYNLILDKRVEDMADVPLKGEFGGYVELISRIELIRELQYLATTDFGYNTTQALHTGLGQGTGAGAAAYAGLYYREKPQISDILTARNMRDLADFDWAGWMMNVPEKAAGRSPRGMYEVTTLYARIVPQDHGMYSNNSTVPQIWKLKVVNNAKLICAQRIISAYDILPILIGQPFEDGFSEQTQSLAETQIPFQRTVSKLINIRIHAARRAVADRGIYDPQMIDETDMNSSHPAAKIPIKQNSKLGGKTLEDAYRPTPFSNQGLETVIQDAALVETMGSKASGINKPQTGEFQRGNKSVKEWNDTMSGSDNRLRLPALVLEYQVMCPVKDQIKLNIYQYGPTGIFQDVKKGQSIDVQQAEVENLRKTVLYFKMADGYMPVSKLASTDAIANGMAMIGNSPVLQQTMGARLPEMFAHLMQLQGVQGLDEYVPDAAEAQANLQNPALAPGAQGAGAGQAAAIPEAGAL